MYSLYPGWFTSARSVTAWDQLPRGDTWHTCDCSLMAHPENQAARARELHKMHGPPGTVHSPSSWSPEWFGPGKGTKCTGHLGSVPLWDTREPKWLRLRKCKITGHTWESVLAEHTGAWAVWSWEVHAGLDCDKLSVVHPLWALPTHASGICLQCPSLPTTQLNKWA